MQRAWVLVCCFVVLLLLSSSAAFASELATVTGYVSDPKGLRVPQCRVQATNVETNVSYTGETNEIGLFRIPAIPVGNYRVIVQKTGFKTIVKEGVELHVQDVLSLNFQLEIGTVAESVNVEGGTPLLNTESAAVSTVVDRNFVENIPLNGRTFQALIALTPGVVLTAATSNEPGQFSVNGQRADANYFSVDGVSANIGMNTVNGLGQYAAGSQPGLSVLGGTNALVSVDAMQEFRVQTSSFAPEFGRTPGGQISIVTRSGGNEFHGGAFDYLRNDIFDANNWFNGYTNNPALPKAKERQNDFGATFGGPVRIPGLYNGHDKTFFFFSYEGLRLRQPLTSRTLVPASNPADLQARQFAPVAMRPYLNAFPLPNGPSVGKGLAEFNASYSNPASLDAYSIRIDHNVNSNLTVFGRYDFAPSESSTRSTLALSDSTVTSVDTHTLTLGLTSVFLPKLSNELRMNYSNVRTRTAQIVDTFGGALPPSDSTIFPSGISSKTGVFQFLYGVLDGAAGLLLGSNGKTEQRQLDFVDNVSATIGSHQLKFGVDYRWLAPISSPASYGQLAEFLHTSDVFASTTNAFFATVSANQTSTLLSRNVSLYGQDTWKTTPRLTVTYGLRWDVNPALKGKDGASEPFTIVGLNNPSTMALAARGTPLYSTTYGNIAPRLGIAYQIRQSGNWLTLFRAGGGIFYDLGSGLLGNVTFAFPFSALKNLSNVPFPLSAQNAAAPAFSLNPAGQSLAVANRNLSLPRTYEWNVALEQSLGSDQTLSVTYVGAAGRKLLRVYQLSLGQLSPRNTTFGSGNITVVTNKGTSDYEALQLQYQRRVAKGLNALASYTYAHSIDNASVDSGAFSAPGVFNALDRGNSNFDIRHAFNGAVTFDIPTPHGNRGVRTILGNWSVDAIETARSATPVDIGVGTTIVAGSVFTTRPNLVSGIPVYLYGSQFPGGKALNLTPNQGGAGCKGPFCPAPAGQQGNLGRNQLRGFGLWQTDFTLRRQFHLAEKASLQFRAEFFNIFNHPNFGNPNSTLLSPQFGRSTQTLGLSLGSGKGGLNSLYQIGGPRSTQLALKFQF